MNIENGMKFDVEIDGLGTVMDYVEDRFIFVIIDHFWNDVEVQMANQMPMEIDFLYRYDLAVFLLSVGDIDTSDFYFNIQENDWCQQLLSTKDCLQCTLVLLDEKNTVCFKRDATFTKEDSEKIIAELQKQREVAFHDGEFDVNMQGLMQALEPFEMQEYAIVKAVFTR